MWILCLQLTGKDKYDEGYPFQRLIQIKLANHPSLHTKYTCYRELVLMKIYRCKDVERKQRQKIFTLLSKQMWITKADCATGQIQQNFCSFIDRIMEDKKKKPSVKRVCVNYV